MHYYHQLIVISKLSLELFSTFLCFDEMNTVFLHSIMNIKMGKTLKKQLNFIQILKISRNMQFAANYDIYMNKNKYSNASNSNV